MQSKLLNKSKHFEHSIRSDFIFINQDFDKAHSNWSLKFRCSSQPSSYLRSRYIFLHMAVLASDCTETMGTHICKGICFKNAEDGLSQVNVATWLAFLCNWSYVFLALTHRYVETMHPHLKKVVWCSVCVVFLKNVYVYEFYIIYRHKNVSNIEVHLWWQ